MKKKVVELTILLGALLAAVLLYGCAAAPSEPVLMIALTTDMQTPEPVTPTPTAEPTATPTEKPTAAPTPEPTPLDLGILDASHADRFSPDEVIDTKNLYCDAKRSITLTRYSGDQRTGRTLVYFVADVWLQNVEDLRRVQADGNKLNGAKINIQKLSEQQNAIVAVSGDHCEKTDRIFCVIDGEVLHNSGEFDRDLCVLYRDGVMVTYAPDEIDPDAIEARGPWISWNFGPSLLDSSGQAKAEFNLPDTIDERNPRVAIGYFEPGHYCLVVVDGRQWGYSQGLSLHELSQLMQELGCKSAYNLDGGISAQITWHGKMVNQQAKERSICDIVCICYPEPEN